MLFFKVLINSDGSVIRNSTQEKIGTIPGFGHTDYFKNPNTTKKYQLKLDDGSRAELYHGGLVEQKNNDDDYKFIESCHARCPSNHTSCFLHRSANNCPYNGKLKEVGFYINIL